MKAKFVVTIASLLLGACANFSPPPIVFGEHISPIRHIKYILYEAGKDCELPIGIEAYTTPVNTICIKQNPNPATLDWEIARVDYPSVLDKFGHEYSTFTRPIYSSIEPRFGGTLTPLIDSTQCRQLEGQLQICKGNFTVYFQKTR